LFLVDRTLLHFLFMLGAFTSIWNHGTHDDFLQLLDRTYMVFLILYSQNVYFLIPGGMYLISKYSDTFRTEIHLCAHVTASLIATYT
jgi:hypothetical protein